MGMDSGTMAAIAQGVDTTLNVGANVLGNALSYRSNRKNRESLERYRSTAHQVEVEDFRKAGINPILTAGGSGAQTPNTQPWIADIEVGNPAGSFLEKRLALAEQANRNMKTREIDNAVAASQINANTAQAAKTMAETNNIVALTPGVAELQAATIAQSKAAAHSNTAQAAKTKAETAVVESDAVRRKAESEIYATPVLGKGLILYEKLIDGMLGGVNATTSARRTSDASKPTYEEEQYHYNKHGKLESRTRGKEVIKK